MNNEPTFASFWRRRVSIVWAVVSTVGAGVISALGGHIATDFFDLRSEVRSAYAKEYDEAQQAYQNLFDDLRLFADQAQGKGTVSSDERKAFRSKVTQLFQSMQDVVDQTPEVKPEFERYKVAIVNMQRSALAFTNPLDAREFVEDYSRFLEQHREINSKIVNMKRAYF